MTTDTTINASLIDAGKDERLENAFVSPDDLVLFLFRVLTDRELYNTKVHFIGAWRGGFFIKCNYGFGLAALQSATPSYHGAEGFYFGFERRACPNDYDIDEFARIVELVTTFCLARPELLDVPERIYDLRQDEIIRI